MLQKGKKPLGVGFFFALGHSTIVLALSIGLAVAARAVQSQVSEWQDLGGTVGASVSGVFLWLIGILNLIVLVGIIDIWRRMKQGTYQREHLEELLLQRGLVNRLLGGRAQRFINHSWQLYPLGLLFGLGFDTASEIGLLALTGGVATGGVSFWAVISLPILFAAGMSLMDTTDGALMTRPMGGRSLARCARSGTTSPPPACRSRSPCWSAPSRFCRCSATSWAGTAPSSTSSTSGSTSGCSATSS
jgi:high-affinity nickel-transport protein